MKLRRAQPPERRPVAAAFRLPARERAYTTLQPAGLLAGEDQA